jgi:hypothetical protein
MAERKKFMIQQQLRTHRDGKLYNFMEHKSRKPFFTQPLNITVGNPLNKTYYLLKNVVFKGKQILALMNEQDPKTIVLVEAKIEEGQIKYISMLSKEVMDEVSGQFLSCVSTESV